jgi:hypothetical protein
MNKFITYLRSNWKSLIVKILILIGRVICLYPLWVYLIVIHERIFDNRDVDHYLYIFGKIPPLWTILSWIVLCACLYCFFRYYYLKVVLYIKKNYVKVIVGIVFVLFLIPPILNFFLIKWWSKHYIFANYRSTYAMGYIHTYKWLGYTFLHYERCWGGTITLNIFWHDIFENKYKVERDCPHDARKPPVWIFL